MKPNKDIKKIGRYVAGGAIGGMAMAAVYEGYKAMNRYRMKDKVVLITGGSRGLGLIMARQLVSQGARIAVCARNKEELVKVAQEFAEVTSEFLSIPCDITNKLQINEMVTEIEEKFGPVDVVINNAGIMQVGPMEKMTDKDYETALNTHFWGPYYIINRVLPSMMERKQGRIINIVSIGGLISVPHLLPYNTSKFALSGYSKGITTELARNNIMVTTVYPGLMRTGSPRHIELKGKHEKEYAWFKTSAYLPLLSMNAEKAARKIINAMQNGDKKLIITVPAKIGYLAQTIAPDLVMSFFDLVNRLLPDVPAEDSGTRKGYEVESEIRKEGS